MSRAENLPIPLRINVDTLTATWGTPIDPELVTLALTHRPYANKAGGIVSNERLESLGGAVLSIVIVDRLFHDHPDSSGPDLSRMQTVTVSQEPLVMAARCTELRDFAYFNRGETGSGGGNKNSILSGTFEVMTGATCLTGGFEIARRIILENLDFLLTQALSRGSYHGRKTPFIEHISQFGLGEVSYEIGGEGPDYDRTFTAKALVSSKQKPTTGGEVSLKKYVETAAAEVTTNALAEP